VPAPIKSQDPLPLNTLRLSEAYELYYRVTRPDWKSIADKAEAELAAYQGYEMEDGSESAVNIYDASRLKAEIEFRNFISAGKVHALICHPVTSEHLEPGPREEWEANHSFCVPGFHDDFVNPNDLFQPGPNAAIGERSLPLFFDRKEFDAFLKTLKNDTAGAQEIKRGAKPRFDWPDVENYGLQVMCENGAFRDWDNDEASRKAGTEWKGKADLIKLMAVYMGKHGAESSLSSLKVHANIVVARWQQEQSAKNAASK
jgi:hypothetical protein